MSFVSVIVNFRTWSAIGLSIIKHLLDQVRIRLILQLLNGFSRVLQKFFKYFNGDLILTFFVSLFSSILAAISVLNLNESLLLLSARRSAIAPLASKNVSSH